MKNVGPLRTYQMASEPRTLNDVVLEEVCVRVQGGLGNQLFQYAAGRAASTRLGVPLTLDLGSFSEDRLRQFELSSFRIKARIRPLNEPMRLQMHTYRESSYHFDPAFRDIAPGTLLIGYFQSQLYFEEIVREIREETQLVEKSGQFNEAFRLISKTEVPVSLHVRRGDFVNNPSIGKVHGVCGLQYYRRALEILSGLVGPRFTLFVFSDDLQAASDLLRQLNYFDSSVFFPGGRAA